MEFQAKAQSETVNVPWKAKELISEQCLVGFAIRAIVLDDVRLKVIVNAVLNTDSKSKFHINNIHGVQKKGNPYRKLKYSMDLLM